MNIKLNYIDGIINVPAEAVMADLGSMEADELRVLLYLCAEPAFRADTDADKAHAIKTLDMQWAAIETALSGLSVRGIISSDEMSADVPAQKKPHKNKASVKADSPVYTKDETAGIIDRNAELHKIINDDVPRLTGKAVTQNEAMILVSMYDYLHLSPESIVKLVDFCRTNGAVSFRVVERTAYTLFDSNIVAPEDIDNFIERKKQIDDITEKVKRLFGIGSRSLISSEKEIIEKWFTLYNCDYSMIEMAYERTIKNINEASLSYTDAILKKWHDLGCKTADDVKKTETDEIKKIDSITNHIRNLFGIGSRKLISTESGKIYNIVVTYGYGTDLIDYAYERMMKSIHEPTIVYLEAIMKKWFEIGVRTVDDVEMLDVQNKSEKTGKKRKKQADAQSYDVDEFLMASMKRSYKEK